MSSEASLTYNQAGALEISFQVLIKLAVLREKLSNSRSVFIPSSSALHDMVASTLNLDLSDKSTPVNSQREGRLVYQSYTLTKSSIVAYEVDILYDVIIPMSENALSANPHAASEIFASYKRKHEHSELTSKPPGLKTEYTSVLTGSKSHDFTVDGMKALVQDVHFSDYFTIDVADAHFVQATNEELSSQTPPMQKDSNDVEEIDILSYKSAERMLSSTTTSSAWNLDTGYKYLPSIVLETPVVSSPSWSVFVLSSFALYLVRLLLRKYWKSESLPMNRPYSPLKAAHHSSSDVNSNKYQFGKSILFPPDEEVALFSPYTIMQGFNSSFNSMDSLSTCTDNTENLKKSIQSVKPPKCWKEVTTKVQDSSGETLLCLDMEVIAAVKDWDENDSSLVLDGEANSSPQRNKVKNLRLKNRRPKQLQSSPQYSRSTSSSPTKKSHVIEIQVSGARRAATYR